MTVSAMAKAFDFANLLARIKDQGLPVAEVDAKTATMVVLGWTADSCVLEGGLVAMIAAGVPYVQQQLLLVEDKIDGVAGDAPAASLSAAAPLAKAFDLAGLVARFKGAGLPLLEADAKLLTGCVLDWVADSAVLEGGLVAMIAPGIPYVKQQVLALEDKIDGQA